MIIAAVTIITSVISSYCHNKFKSTCTRTKFTAQLSGQQEVPPTNSKATGMAEFKVNGQNIEYSGMLQTYKV